MSSVTAQIALNIDATYAGSSDLGTPKQRISIAKALSLVGGTDAITKANLLFADERTLASNTTENLDLAGVLTDAFGAIFTAAEIVAIYLEADDGNTVALDFFGAAANGFNGPLSGTAPKLRLLGDEWTVLGSKRGWTVTAATGDILLVSNAAGAASTYRIVVIGRTVAA